MIWVAVVAMGLLALWLSAVAVNYYATVLGLLYYIAMDHSDMLDANKVKALRDDALQRIISERFKKH